MRNLFTESSLLCFCSNGNGPVRRIYSLCATAKPKGIYSATYRAAHLRCFLGVFFLVPFQRQCHGEGEP